MLVTQQVIGGSIHSEDAVQVSITFEVWNRRKYPIRLEWIFLDFRNERAGYEELASGWHWYGGGKKFAYEPKGVVEPNSRSQHVFQATFKGTTGEEFHDDYTLDAQYYDPKRNKQKKASAGTAVDHIQTDLLPLLPSLDTSSAGCMTFRPRGWSCDRRSD